MNKTFLARHDDEKEILELVDNTEWLFVRYKNGEAPEKTTYILKREDDSLYEILSPFIMENEVSELMIAKLKKYEIKHDDSKQLLLMGASFHLSVIASTGILIFLGYQLGKFADTRFKIFPIYTTLGILLGISIGVFFSYKMFQKYLKPYIY